jgi:hypothetical protein
VSFFNDRGIWIETDAGLREVARTDDPMPGVEGRDFGGFSNLVVNDAGRVAFTASSTSLFLFDSIFSEGTSGQLELVTREFRAAPGTSEANFDFNPNDFVGIPELTLNQAGQVAFTSGLTGPGVNEGNDMGLWAQDTSGELKLIVREGDEIEAAPGDSRVVERFGFGGMNDLGQIAFDAIFTDGTSGVFLSNEVARVAGDYNGNGLVDAADYTVWRDQLGQSIALPNESVTPGIVTLEDYDDWKARFGDTTALSGTLSRGAVSEPTSLLLLLSLSGSMARWRRATG